MSESSGTGDDGAYDYTASASDGTEPYTYTWESVKNSDDNTASIDSPSDSVTISCTATDAVTIQCYNGAKMFVIYWKNKTDTEPGSWEINQSYREYVDSVCGYIQ